jgi:hypothetical protein
LLEKGWRKPADTRMSTWIIPYEIIPTDRLDLETNLPRSTVGLSTERVMANRSKWYNHAQVMTSIILSYKKKSSNVI